MAAFIIKTNFDGTTEPLLRVTADSPGDPITDYSATDAEWAFDTFDAMWKDGTAKDATPQQAAAIFGRYAYVATRED